MIVKKGAKNVKKITENIKNTNYLQNLQTHKLTNLVFEIGIKNICECQEHKI